MSMRFDCGKAWHEKYTKRTNWHSWFAWYPVRVGPHDCRWAERVERKGTLHCGIVDTFWHWEYRARG